MPEFIDPVFVKTSTKRSFSVIQNERFGLVFVKTGSIISGTGFFRNEESSGRLCRSILFYFFTTNILVSFKS